MREPGQQSPLAFFDAALSIAFVLPVGFQGQHIPMLWVAETERAEVEQVKSRLFTIGEQAGRLGEAGRLAAYGNAYTLWILARELYPDTFFLHLALDAPAVTGPYLTLPKFSAEYLIRCDLERESTEQLLRSIADGLCCLVNFERVPPWVREWTSIRVETLEQEFRRRISQLIRSSLPVFFNEEGFGVVNAQFDAWQLTRGGESSY
jgi:hypothetical protein